MPGFSSPHFESSARPLSSSLYALSSSFTTLSSSYVALTSSFTTLSSSYVALTSSFLALSGAVVTGTVPTTDNAIVRWNGTDARGIQNSIILVSDTGIIETNTGNTLRLCGSGSTTAGAIQVAAVPGAAALPSDTILLEVGWRNDVSTFTGSWNFYENSYINLASSSAEIRGTAPDGGSTIGVVLGSSASYTTAGAKLLSVQNQDYEREYVGYDGQKTIDISDYAGYTQFGHFSEYLSISGSRTYFTVGQIPAGATVYAGSVRVLTSFQTASAFGLGVSASVWNAAAWTQWAWLPGNAGVTNQTSSMAAGFICYANATPLAISCSVLQGNTTGVTGSLRVEARWMYVGIPTS